MTTPMTPLGEQQLRSELESLHESRMELSKAIGEAIKLGDLRENADYHAAKDQQGLVEARIRQIESKLADAEIIDVKKLPNQDRVVFGSTVTLFDFEAEKEVVYQIVGDDEADISINKIAISSPIARALIGQELNDDIELQTPHGPHAYEIQKIELK